MNMSRATRKQLLGCDLVQGVLDSAPQAYEHAGKEVPAAVHSNLFRLQRAIDSASKFACQRLDENGKWQLDDKATRQYSKALDEVKEKLLAMYGPALNAIDYIKAVQVWVEDLRAELPAHPPDRRIMWRDIAELLQALYLAYDPDQDADAEIDAGMVKGEAFKEAAGCWS